MAESFEAGPEGGKEDPQKAPESPEENLEERPSEAPEQPEETPEKPPEKPEEKPKSETVTGLVCANCGAPVKETQPNRYFCTEEKKFVQVTTPGERGGGETSERPPSGVIREIPTPNDILKRVLELDPKLDDEQIEWIMDNTNVYGVLSTNDISSLIQDLNIKGAGKTARRVTRKYASALQHQLNDDPELQNEEEWRNLIYKESGYRPPSRGIEGDRMNLSPVPMQNQGQNPSPASAIGSMGMNQPQPPQIGGFAQPQGRNLNAHQGQGHSQPQNQPLTEERLHKILDEREREQEEKKKERQMKEMISKQQQLIENLNTRLTSLEKNPSTPREGGSESKSEIRELKENINDLNDIMENLGGGEESSVPPELQATLGNIDSKLDDLGSPSGEMNEYDMEVKKAEHEAEARKTEAEERRKGFKEIADAIRDTADNVGWSIGESVARGGERSSNPGQSQGNPQAQMQNQDYFEPKPVRKREDGSRVLEGCPYKDCDREEDIAIEQGKSTTTCPDCNRVLTVPAAE